MYKQIVTGLICCSIINVVSAENNWLTLAPLVSYAKITNSLAGTTETHTFPGLRMQVFHAFTIKDNYGASLGFEGALMNGDHGAVATGQTQLKYQYGAKLYPWVKLNPKTFLALSLGYGGSKIDLNHGSYKDNMTLSGLLYGFAASYAVCDSGVVIFHYDYSSLGRQSIDHSGSSHTYKITQSNISLGYGFVF